MILTEQSQEVVAFIREALDLSPRAANIDTEDLYNLFSLELPLQPDLVFRDYERLYFVEIKSKIASIDTIARMQLLRELWHRRGPDRPPVEMVIAARAIRPREEQLARELEIRVIKVPWTLTSPIKNDFRPSKSKITTDKSWKIVSRLLKEKSTSIRQLALQENVSYGWAHKTVETLMNQNIAKKNDSYVQISDVKKLLNGIAWERPMKNLNIAEIPMQFGDSIPAARDITHMLSDQKVPFAFTGYTAGGLYTGYAVRQDAVYLYLDRKDLDLFVEIFKEPSKELNRNSIRAWIYAPDRDVFTNTQQKEGITVVSPPQTLLDLAGFGYSAMDLTKAMVDRYDTL
ncbi:MAG: hypothetical protein GX837_04395 [Methanomicrobiales archaeon]|nr:hypothetical protein [Methanomicrobiales archaeon]